MFNARHRPTAGRRLQRRIFVTVLALLVVALTASGAMAATVTKNALAAGIPGFPSTTGGLGVFEAGTPDPPPDAVREVGTYAVSVIADPAVAAEAPFAGAWKAYGVTDIRNHTDTGVASPMVLQLAADAWAGEFLADVPAKLTWLLRHADALIAGEHDTQRAAAAIQVVVWQTLRNPQNGLLPRADLVTPSTDPAVNALAVKFTALMDAALLAAPAGDVAVSLVAGPLTGCTSTLTVTGTPGVPVRMTVDNGGILTSPVVVLDPAGTAQTTVHGVAGVTVTVTATVATGGVLVRADGAHDPDVHTTEENQSRAPEELIFLAGAGQSQTSVSIRCGTPPAAPPAGPVRTPAAPADPVVSAVGTSGGQLQLTKAGPPTAVAGKRITYRLRVRNSGSVPVTAVVLRDTLPSGLTLVARPKGLTIKSGVLTWRLGTIAPGAQRVLTLTVRVDANTTGQRCNTASASADNAATVRARACSTIRAVAGVSRLPVVAG